MNATYTAIVTICNNDPIQVFLLRWWAVATTAWVQARAAVRIQKTDSTMGQLAYWKNVRSAIRWLLHHSGFTARQWAEYQDKVERDVLRSAAERSAG